MEDLVGVHSQWSNMCLRKLSIIFRNGENWFPKVSDIVCLSYKKNLVKSKQIIPRLGMVVYRKFRRGILWFYEHTPLSPPELQQEMVEKS